MILPIKKKLVLIYTAFFGTLLFIIAIFAIHDIRRNINSTLSLQMTNYSYNLKNQLVQQLLDNRFPDIKRFAEIKEEGLIDKKFMVFDRSGKKLLTDTDFFFRLPDNWKTNLQNENESLTLNHDKKMYYVLFSEVIYNHKDKFIIAASASRELYDDQYLHHIWFFALSIPIALLLASLAAYRISNYSFEPVVRMINSVKKITAHNLGERIELPKAKDEIYSLGETLNKMIDDLEKSFESQKRFIEDASHEIKTPLTIIHAHMEILKDKLSDDSLKDEVGQLLSEVEKLNSLTLSLLKLANLNSGKTELNINKFRLDETLLDVIRLIRKEAEKKNTVFRLSVNEPVTMEGDENQIKCALMNIIDNAVKYSLPKTSIDIDISVVNDTCIITVEDRGHGISSKDIKNIFNRFFRSNETKSIVQGNGLGLAITKDILRLHQGNINIESKEGLGTKVIITLPISVNLT